MENARVNFEREKKSGNNYLIYVVEPSVRELFCQYSYLVEVSSLSIIILSWIKLFSFTFKYCTPRNAVMIPKIPNRDKKKTEMMSRGMLSQQPRFSWYPLKVSNSKSPIELYMYLEKEEEELIFLLLMI